MGWIREGWKNNDMYSLTIFTTRVKLNCLSNWGISLLICPWFRYSDSKHNFWLTRLWYTVTLVTVLIYSHSVLRTFLQHRIPSTDTWLVSHIYTTETDHASTRWIFLVLMFYSDRPLYSFEMKIPRILRMLTEPYSYP